MATSPRIDKDQKKGPFFDKHNKAHSGICDWGRLETRGAIPPDKGDSAAVSAATCETSLPWPSPCFPITKPRSPLLLTNAWLRVGRRHRCIANKEVALKKEKVEVGRRAPNTTNPPPTATRYHKEENRNCRRKIKCLLKVR